MSKKVNIEKAIAVINSRLNEHVGSNGKANHLPADRDHSGFATPQNIVDIDEALGNRTTLPGGTDVMTLVPGRYSGNNMVNVSNEEAGGGRMVDVSQLSSDIKQIVELRSYKGDIHVYTQHKSGDNINSSAPITWTSIERYETLFEGSALTAVGTSITLSDLAQKFDNYRVTFQTGVGQVESRNVKKKGRDVTVNTFNEYDSSIGIQFFELVLSLKDDKTAQIIRNSTYAFSANAPLYDTSDANVITILKIEGVI